MNIIDKEPVLRAKKALKDFDGSLNVIEVKTSARTAIDAANSLNCEIGAIVKSLLFKTEKNFILCLVAGDKKCSLKKLKKITNLNDIKMASPDEVKQHTGYTIGGVSPVGHLSDLQIYIDTTLERFAKIFAAAGHPNCVFDISFNNLIKLTNGKIENLIE